MAAIVFDFDGTLGDSLHGILVTAHEVLRRMDWPTVDDAALTATIGLPLHENFTKGAGMPDELASRAEQLYRDIFDTVGAPEIQLFPGVRETLETLAARGIPMAIASSRGQHSLTMLVKMLGIDRFIPADRCFGLQTVARPKPAPDLVYVILGKLGVKPEETLVVGDTVYDIEMGRNAGCHTCAVTYGNQSADTLAGAFPDYIIDDLRKLL
ncbi:MAG: HAD family hydrolase [Bacteroidales bacterium]|nr:HAD family hydrolase [Bacteroidales bacterium]